MECIHPVKRFKERPLAGHSTAGFLLEGLNELGIEYIFCNLGTDHAPIIEEMARRDRDGQPYPKPIVCPHENVAIHMAAGYTFATGRAQAALVHVDVGTANSVNGLHNLCRSRVPLLLMAGKAPFTVRGELPGSRDNFIHFVQEPFDMASLARPFVKWDYALYSGVMTKEVLRRAYSVAHSDPPGPVFLTLQREVLMQEWERSQVASFPAEKYGPTLAAGADEETLQLLADRLLSARRPAMITAYSGRNPACPPVVEQLAELIGMPVFQFNYNYMNISRRSPCYASAIRPADLDEIDLGLMVDVDVPWIPRSMQENPKTTWFHIDVDTVKKDIPVWGFPSHYRVQGDSHKVLASLLERLRQRMTPKVQTQARQRIEQITAKRQAVEARIAGAAQNKGTIGQISPAYVCAEVNRVIGANDIVISEVITNSPALDQQIPRTVSGTFLHLGGCGLGCGGGAALGAKLAKPEANVFHFTGDGSFYFSNPSAVYAVSSKYDLPIFTIILDNSGWGAVKEATLRVYPDGAARQADQFRARLAEQPHLEKIAEAFGAYGACVEDPKDLPAAIDCCMDALRKGRSALLLARVTNL
jgi:acetolactate synthase-1/2/3 large subunit